MQKDQVVFACMSMYAHVLAVYACILSHKVAEVVENVYIVSISNYLHVYACIWIVYYKITVNLAAKHP